VKPFWIPSLFSQFFHCLHQANAVASIELPLGYRSVGEDWVSFIAYFFVFFFFAPCLFSFSFVGEFFRLSRPSLPLADVSRILFLFAGAGLELFFFFEFSGHYPFFVSFDTILFPKGPLLLSFFPPWLPSAAFF